MEKNKHKLCLVSSSGGHFEQLLMLKKLNQENDIFIVTEQTKYNKENKDIKYFLKQVNRKEVFFPIVMLINFLKSIYIFMKEKPDIIISTGVLATIPMLVLGHILKKKVIYIESFAKISGPTMTGKFIYNKKIADQFYVQWESMLEVYPNAIYMGGIY